MILIGKQADELSDVLREHLNHTVRINLYGKDTDDNFQIWDAALECEDCGCVILDGDRTISSMDESVAEDVGRALFVLGALIRKEHVGTIGLERTMEGLASVLVDAGLTIPCASCGRQVIDDGHHLHVHSGRTMCDEEV